MTNIRKVSARTFASEILIFVCCEVTECAHYFVLGYHYITTSFQISAFLLNTFQSEVLPGLWSHSQMVCSNNFWYLHDHAES